jgi:3-deoxy-D-manno-octulosonic-acid transferase
MDMEDLMHTKKTSDSGIKTIIGKRKVVVFASTHKGEEEKIIHAYLNQPLDALNSA